MPIFTNQHILRAVVNGTGDLTIEKDRFRFKPCIEIYAEPINPEALTDDAVKAFFLYTENKALTVWCTPQFKINGRKRCTRLASLRK